MDCHPETGGRAGWDNTPTEMLGKADAERVEGTKGGKEQGVSGTGNGCFRRLPKEGWWPCGGC